MSHIDWVKCIVPLMHKDHIHGGARTRFEDSTFKKIDFAILENTYMEGSGSSRVSVRTVDAWHFFEPKEDESVNDTLVRHCSFLPKDFVESMLSGGIPEKYKGVYFFLQIEGNLVKYFQGQSIYGSMNAYGLVVDFMRDVCSYFKVEPTSHDLNMWRCGFFYLQRLDICENRRLGSYKEVDSFIHGVVKSASLNGRGFRFDHNEKEEGFTAVQSTSGRLCRFSVYNKHCDLRDNKYGKPKFDDEELNHALVDHANGLVRFEAKYKSSWFRRNNIDTMFELRKQHGDLTCLLYDKIDGMKFGGENMQKEVLKKLGSKLPNHIHLIFFSWLQGHTVAQIKEILGDGKRTKAADQRYYKASRYLKEKHGINIKVRLTNAEIEKNHVSGFVPLVSVLKAEASEAPQWFHDKGLIYTPSDHGLYKEG